MQAGLEQVSDVIHGLGIVRLTVGDRIFGFSPQMKPLQVPLA